MFYFYPHYFHIKYNFCSKNYLLLLVNNNLLSPVQKVTNSPNYSVFDCFIFFQVKKIYSMFNNIIFYFFYLFQALKYSSLQVKTLNRAYKQIINRMTRSLYILKIYFISKQHYQDTIQFFSKYRYKTEPFLLLW